MASDGYKQAHCQFNLLFRNSRESLEIKWRLFTGLLGYYGVHSNRDRGFAMKSSQKAFDLNHRKSNCARRTSLATQAKALGGDLHQETGGVFSRFGAMKPRLMRNVGSRRVRGNFIDRLARRFAYMPAKSTNTSGRRVSCYTMSSFANMPAKSTNTSGRWVSCYTMSSFGGADKWPVEMFKSMEHKQDSVVAARSDIDQRYC
jgi:hypothetical protein